MLKERARLVGAVLMAGDLAAVSIAFLLAYLLRHQILPDRGLVTGTLPPLSAHAALMALALVLWAASLRASGAYASHRTRSLPGEAWEVTRASGLALLLFVVAVFLTKLDGRVLDGERMSRSLVGLWAFLAVVLLVAHRLTVRWIAHGVRRRGRNFRNILVVGASDLGRAVAHSIAEHEHWGLRLVGFVTGSQDDKRKAVDGVSILGGLDDLLPLTEKMVVDEVFLAAPELPFETAREIVTQLSERGVGARIGLVEHIEDALQPRIERLGSLQFLTFDPTSVSEVGLVLKRGSDFVIATVLLILLSPLVAFAALAIRWTSPGSILFRQTRVGLRGRQFTLLKFRTMHQGAENRQRELEAHNEMTGPVFKVRNDPRVTRVGRFLRRFSLDELPQLWNVVRGDMSLVGPRPPTPEEVLQYEPWQRRRLSMRPGMTCLWQVAGRSEIDFERWVALDLEYIDNWSPWLDFRILLRTIPAVISGRGAY